ncbi:unnamed protein product [Ilex paraguariensis]|uniref:Uncharacterized protein n=1 Tax=Ilex paraguariensis TaxID=185542 RepID=A0ABC8QSE4_9AQUA
MADFSELHHEHTPKSVWEGICWGVDLEPQLRIEKVCAWHKERGTEREEEEGEVVVPVEEDEMVTPNRGVRWWLIR